MTVITNTNLITMAELRQYKESENKVHELLYENLLLLSHFYPTSKDFKAVFKRDMFVKSNKAAFFEVVFYLLNTLNTELTKQNITTWPPYEIKRENKFRGEVLKYINELNTLYDNADIPHIMSSHLISPGGFKFAKFMLKLSQLVVYEHLKKTEKCQVLYCPKPSKKVNLTKANVNNLKKKTALIENETKDILRDFENNHFQLNEKALQIDKELKVLNDKIREAKQTNVRVREEFNKNYPSYPSFKSLEEKIQLLKTEWESLQEIQDAFKACEELMTYLNSNELVLEHCKETLKLPNEVLHIVRNQDELNLNEFFYGLTVLLEQKALELPNPTNSFISQNSEKVKELNEQYCKINAVLSENVEQLDAMIEKMASDIKLLVALTNSEEEETLAVPLTDIENSD